jgi:hypothetical protein
VRNIADGKNQYIIISVIIIRYLHKTSVVTDVAEAYPKVKEKGKRRKEKVKSKEPKEFL